MRFIVAFLVVFAGASAFGQKLSRISLTLSPLPGGIASTGTVELSDKAGKTPVVVTLSSSSTTVTLPNSVTVATGQPSVPFSITTLPVAADTTVVIKATVGSVTLSTNLIVQSPRVSEFSFNPAGVQGGSKSTGTVKINTAAPVGGVKVALTSNTPYWGGPSSLLIPAGATSGSFSVTTLPVVGVTDAGVTAALAGVRISTALNITPARFQTFTIDHMSVVGGSSAIGTLTLDGPAPKEGFRVKVSIDSPLIRVPANIAVPSGQTTITFTISTKPVKSATTVRISAGGPGAWVELPLEIVPPATGAS